MTPNDHAADATFFASEDDPIGSNIGPNVSHFLIMRDHFCRQIPVGRTPVTIGRLPPCEIVLNDTQISRAHARVHLVDDQLVVTDLDSTNGTFADGHRVLGSKVLEHGAVLRIGTSLLAYERRTWRELEIAAALERDTRDASSYVQSLLPEPVCEGPVQTEWVFLPCAQLGGSGFGTGMAGDAVFCMFMLGVAGYGTSAAMQSVAIMSVLSQRTLPGADFTEPGSVLRQLNVVAGLTCSATYTLWYGAFDQVTRELSYASAGHLPGLLQVRGQEALSALSMDCPAIGIVSAHEYQTGRMIVPPNATLVLLNDGVSDALEQQGVADTNNVLSDIIRNTGRGGVPNPSSLHSAVRSLCKNQVLDEDFVALVVTLP